ncbi:MAG: choice-of-anchor D domain-containing protein [Bacteroidetes bacterium]|nr:choice-of-anchor D domain-containing protein [Bacteroidota bacterium]
MLLRLCSFVLLSSALFSQHHSFESFQGPYGASSRALAVSGDGTVFLGTSVAGIFRSTNSGAAWATASIGMTEPNVSAFLVLPGNIVLAGTSLEKVFRSTNGGMQWTELSSLIPQGLNGVTYSSVTGFASAPGGMLYASSGQNGVFMSPDHGASWLQMGLSGSIQFIASNSLGYVYASTSSKLYRSLGDSASWTTLEIVASGTISALAVAPDNAVLAAVSGSVYRSTDHGNSWMKIYAGTSSQPVRPIAALQDGSLMFATRHIIYRSSNNGSTWSQRSLHSVPGSTTFGIVDAGNGLLMAANNIGGVYRSENAGDTWQISNVGLNGGRISSTKQSRNGTMYAKAGTREVFHRSAVSSQWTAIPLPALQFTVTDITVTPESLLFVASNRGIFRTTDLGAHWTAADTIGLPYPVTALLLDSLSHGLFALTGNNGLFHSNNLGDSWTLRSPPVTSNTVSAIRRSPSGTLFLIDGQEVYRSTNDGGNWGGPFTVVNASISDIAFTPLGTVYLLAANTLYRSLNDGISYTNVANGSIYGGTVLRVTGENRLLAGSQAGVMRSTNGGASWKTFAAGLQNTTVNTLDISADGHLLAGTNTGIWKSVAPELNYAFNVDSLQFGTVRVGRTVTDTIILRNGSPVPLTVSSVTSAAPVFDPLIDSFTVAGSDSVLIPVTFTPAGRSWYSGFLIVKGSNGSDTIPLSGAGKAAVLSLSTHQLNFPDRLSHLQSAQQSVTIYNTGDDKMTISHTAVSHPAFSVSLDSFVVLPNQSRTQTVTFAPDTPGTFSASLRYHSDALPANDSVALTGKGILRAIPLFFTSTLQFGRVQVDSFRSLTVRIANTGNDTLRVIREDTLDELIHFNHSLILVPPQDTIRDTVTVRPPVFGEHATYAKYLLLNDSSRRFIAVYATGYELSQPAYSLKKIDAGIRPTGVSVDTIITITNTGTDTLRLVKRVTGGVTRKLDRSVLPGGSVQDTISITPGYFGRIDHPVLYHTNAFNTPDTVLFSIFGRGKPAMVFEPSSGYTFANVESTKTKLFPLMIYNNGEDTLKVTGSYSSDPRFTTSAKPFVLLPHQMIVADTIRYTAQNAGKDTAFIVYQTNTPAGADTMTVIGISTGGSYWLMMRSFFDTPLSAFTMALNGTMIVATNSGFFYSDDAGATWNKGSIADSMTQVLNFVQLPDGVLLASSARQGVLRSVDNGRSWKKLQSPVMVSYCSSVIRTADGRVIALQQSNDPLVPKMIVSTDRGDTWTALPSQLKNPSLYTQFFASSRGPLFLMDHTVAELRLVRSLDGGNSWQPLKSPPNPKVTRIFREGRRGLLYASLYNGGAAVSSDTGTTWTSLYTGGSVTDLFETKDSVLFISVYGQSIKRSVNNGSSWTDLPLMGNVFMEPFVRHYNGTLWWGHEFGVYASRNAVTGRSAVETVPAPVRTGPVDLSTSMRIAVPLFNNTADTISQIVRQLNNPRFSFIHTALSVAPNKAVVDTLLYTPLAVISAETCAVEYQTPAGTVVAQVIGQGRYPVSVEWTGNMPAEFSLEQNYPNPFNPSTTIGFTVPASGRVTLRIFNALGQMVKELIAADLAAGQYSIPWNAAEQASGVYFYRLTAGGRTETRRMLLMK